MDHCFFFNFSLIHSYKISNKTDVPLGIAYDGSVLWVADVRNKTLQGYIKKNQQRIKARRIRLPGLRDIAFWENYIVSVYGKWIWLINPINAHVVDKINAPFLKKPVSIAINGNLAYIFDDQEKKFYRFDLKQRYLFGYFRYPEGNLRGITYHKGNLWAIQKGGYILKIDPYRGDFTRLFPVSEKSLGISFVEGELVVSQPNRIQSVDYLEGKNHIASSAINLQLSVDITLNPVWTDSIGNSGRLSEIYFKGMPFRIYQRYKYLNYTASDLHSKRKDHGETEFKYNFSEKETKKKIKMSARVIKYNIYYFLDRNSISDYFKKESIPKNIIDYIDTSHLKAKKLNELNNFIKKWNLRKKNYHPYRIIQLLYNKAKKELDFQIFLLRTLGIPARRTFFYDMLQKKSKEFLQIYLKPLEWITISDKYDPTYPKQFPLRNTLLEFYYDGSIKLKPLPNTDAQINYKEILYWDNFQIQKVKKDI